MTTLTDTLPTMGTASEDRSPWSNHPDAQFEIGRHDLHRVRSDIPQRVEATAREYLSPAEAKAFMRQLHAVLFSTAEMTVQDADVRLAVEVWGTALLSKTRKLQPRRSELVKFLKAVLDAIEKMPESDLNSEPGEDRDAEQQ